MSVNTENDIKSLVDHFTPEIMGALWITNEELNHNLSGFNDFNYIFDGLISQYIYGKQIPDSEKHLERTNIFFTHNFNQKLFLVHLQMHGDFAKILDEQMTIIEGNSNDKINKILLFDLTQKNWINNLQKRFPKYEFINLRP